MDDIGDDQIMGGQREKQVRKNGGVIAWSSRRLVC
jgi:hypothetical protein